jgi:CRP-like cAMP-binding protein
MTGAIKIMLPSDTGDEAILATLRSGDVFGELALLDGAPRSATATALEPTETLVLPRIQFRELLATEPAIRDALLASIAGELRRLTNHVEELHFLDITGRLASRLARLAAESGKRAADGSIRLGSPLTQGDLAAMIGCTRQSVNKLLGLFTDDGLVRLERDTIVILDLDGLLKTARR